ncbi:hypothetical protein, partial [Desulfovibrio piger]|uniref:hypothetical protein n=1 Tax=Desulfovibrio piger TaxID=901 RepID=UPI0039F5534F
ARWRERLYAPFRSHRQAFFRKKFFPFVKADNFFKQSIIKTRKKILLKPHHSSAFMTLTQADCYPDNSLPGHHRMRVHKNILHFFPFSLWAAYGCFP